MQNGILLNDMQAKLPKAGKDPLGSVSAIVFDVGDTLFATTELMKSSLIRAAEKLKDLGFISDPELFCQIYLQIDGQISGPSINHLFSGVTIIEEVWNAVGLPYSPSSAGTFLGFYRDLVRQGITVDSRLTAVFTALKRSGYRLAVLSDGSTEEQLEQLFRLGIVGLLDTVVTSQQVGAEKPSRQMFEFLLSSLSVQPCQAVMVGNDPIRDISGAASVGMPSILVTRYSQGNQVTAGSDLVVSDVSDLREVFVKKNARN